MDMIHGEKSNADRQNFDQLAPADKTRLQSSLVEFVVTKMRQFSIVEDESFHRLLPQFVDTAVRCGRFDAKRGLCSTKSLTNKIEDEALTALVKIKRAIRTLLALD